MPSFDYINGSLMATLAEVMALKTLAGYFATVIETTSTTAKIFYLDFFAGRYSLGQR
jgi:hypothetical protein